MYDKMNVHKILMILKVGSQKGEIKFSCKLLGNKRCLKRY